MARFSGGYFPVPRAWYVEDPVINPFFKYKAARDLMVLLLQWAAVQETELCQRGQVVTSWEELGGALGVSVSAARRRQAILQKVKKADRKGDRYGLLITVIDYEAYYEVGQAADRKADKNPTGTRHHMEERKKERKSIPPSERLVTFEADDPWAPAYRHLLECPVYAEVFHVPKDRAHLEHLAKDYALTPQELASVAYELKVWAEGPKGQKMKNPRSTLTNFVKNHVKYRQSPVKDPEAAKPNKRI